MIRILIPLDSSASAEDALNHAIMIGRAFPAELLLLHVVSESDNREDVRADSVEVALWRHQANAYLDGLREKYALEEMLITCEVAEGNPAEVIAQYLANKKPDLLVLTRYGRGDAHDFIAGGTAQKIVSSADCSVLLLDPRNPVDPEKNYERILVPLDDRKDSESALAVATMIAEIHGASLSLVYVIEEPRLPRGLPATRDARRLVDEMHRLVRQEAEQRLNSLASRIPATVDVETSVLVASDPSFAIESAADDRDSDLLLLHRNASGKNGRPRHDSVTQALIQYSHRPLFILQPPKGEGLASNFRSVYLNELQLEAG